MLNQSKFKNIHSLFEAEDFENEESDPLLHYKSFKGRKWLLVFYHKLESDENLFASNEEALFTSQENKYSILKIIDSSFAVHGKYEFLLEYPKFKNEYNHWTQTVNPIKAQSNADNGYKPIHISWSSCGWHGLALTSSSSSSNAFIDGSPFEDDTWFYAIGQKTNWHDSIPSFKEEIKKYATNEVKLWIRVSREQSKCPQRRSIHTNSFVLFH